MQENDPAAAISAAAQGERDPVCMEALDLFIRHYGREASNHALKLMALGGVFLTGGVAPKVSSRFAEAGFLDAFWDKGRMRDLMRRMPVYLVTNENLALYGAATRARRLAAES
jgi:glucokinase